MASTSETGHRKNVVNFEDLIHRCTLLGATYNPANAALKLATLNIQAADANAILETVIKVKATDDKEKRLRAIGIKGLRPLATRVVNALQSAGIPQLKVDDIKSIQRRMYGKRAKTIEKATELGKDGLPIPAKTISVSRQSIISLIESFTILISAAKQEPLYAPNEKELKVKSLYATLASLEAQNDAAMTSSAQLERARAYRNALLYNKTTGLVRTAALVKRYVKSTFGSTSKEYKQLTSIKFKTPPRV